MCVNKNRHMMIQVCEFSPLESSLDLRALVFCTSQDFLQSLEEDWQACCQVALPSQRGLNVLCLSEHLHMRPTAVLEYWWSRMFTWSVSETYIYIYIHVRFSSVCRRCARFGLSEDKVSQAAQLFEQKSLLEFAAVNHGHRQTCCEVSCRFMSSRLHVSYHRSLKSIFSVCSRVWLSSIPARTLRVWAGTALQRCALTGRRGVHALGWHRYGLMLQRCVVYVHVIVSVISQSQSQVWELRRLM